MSHANAFAAAKARVTHSHLTLMYPLYTQEELVIVESQRDDGCKAQIVYCNQGTVTAEDLELLCTKVGADATFVDCRRVQLSPHVVTTIPLCSVSVLQSEHICQACWVVLCIV